MIAVQSAAKERSLPGVVAFLLDIHALTKRTAEKSCWDYDDWNVLFKAAIDRGLLTRDELMAEVDGPTMAEQSAANNRIFRSILDTRMIRAMVVDTFRSVRDGKREGLSPFQLKQRMHHASVVAGEEARLEREAFDKRHAPAPAVPNNVRPIQGSRRRRQLDAGDGEL